MPADDPNAEIGAPENHEVVAEPSKQVVETEDANDEPVEAVRSPCDPVSAYPEEVHETPEIASEAARVESEASESLRRDAESSFPITGETPPTPDPRAMEEWKQLQTIVGRLEGLEFQIRGWLLVLIGALVAALFSTSSKLTPGLFLVIGMLVVAVFCFMELTSRVPKRKSIHRSRDVEAALRGGLIYDGPKIVWSLTDAPQITPKSLLGEFFIANVLFFYVPLFIVVFAIGKGPSWMHAPTSNGWIAVTPEDGGIVYYNVTSPPSGINLPKPISLSGDIKFLPSEKGFRLGYILKTPLGTNPVIVNGVNAVNQALSKPFVSQHPDQLQIHGAYEFTLRDSDNFDLANVFSEAQTLVAGDDNDTQSVVTTRIPSSVAKHTKQILVRFIGQKCYPCS